MMTCSWLLAALAGPTEASNDGTLASSSATARTARKPSPVWNSLICDRGHLGSHIHSAA